LTKEARNAVERRSRSDGMIHLPVNTGYKNVILALTRSLGNLLGKTPVNKNILGIGIFL
jgi:hypothetical protein